MYLCVWHSHTFGSRQTWPIFFSLSSLFCLRQLAPDDAWKCPHCKQLQQGMVKMSLWTLPDILILHLKRFRQVGERRNKLTTLVHFPLTGLDMAPHMVNHSPTTHPATRDTSWDQSRQQRDLAPLDFMYDLYAVCNHHGGMHGGHYTGVNTSTLKTLTLISSDILKVQCVIFGDARLRSWLLKPFFDASRVSTVPIAEYRIIHAQSQWCHSLCARFYCGTLGCIGFNTVMSNQSNKKTDFTLNLKLWWKKCI